MSKKWDVYVYGDINIDLIVPDVDALPPKGQEKIIPVMETHIGGGAALFVLGVQKLGLKTVFEGSVGNDCYGTYIKNLLMERGVGMDYLTTDDKLATGISISFTNSSDRCFLTTLGTNGKLSIDNIDVAHVANARHIHMTGYSGSKNHAQYLALLKKIHELKDVTVSFDVGWDDSGEWYSDITELFPYIDIMFMNETECCHYGRKEDVREAAAELARTANLLVIKRGGLGALAVKDNNIVSRPSFKVNAVDTTGAGDSFNAGFVSAFLSDFSLEECLAIANACGALSVTGRGGNTCFPNKTELFDFLKKYT